jgi:Lon protease-like protein
LHRNSAGWPGIVRSDSSGDANRGARRYDYGCRFASGLAQGAFQLAEINRNKVTPLTDKTDKTTTGLPLFPLNTVLFPGGLLPLQIFEVRYLHMIGQCQRDGAPFGVVGLLRGDEVRKPGAEGPSAEIFQTLGTLARIVEFAAPVPGLLQIQCVGERRFRVLQHARQLNGLWVADVVCLEPDPPMPIPDDLVPAANKLGSLIRLLQSRGTAASEMPFRAPYELDDCAWVANRWCELLPLEATHRQDLLAQESPLLRLELVNDILDRTDLPF